MRRRERWISEVGAYAGLDEMTKEKDRVRARELLTRAYAEPAIESLEQLLERIARHIYAGWADWAIYVMTDKTLSQKTLGRLEQRVEAGFEGQEKFARRKLRAQAERMAALLIGERPVERGKKMHESGLLEQKMAKGAPE